MVYELLSAGADGCVSDAGGATPLHLASGGGHERIVRALLASFTTEHTSVNGQDRSGRTALHWASAHNHDAVVHALIAAGANTDIRDVNGQTASASALRRTGCALVHDAMLTRVFPCLG